MLHNDRNYRTEGIVRSSSATDLEAMKQVFLSYQYDRSPKYFMDPEWEQVSGEEVSFSAEGPFGVCGLDDIDVFRRMASAAPEARMEAAAGNKYPYDSYSCIKERLRCRLENGVLTTEITTTTAMRIISLKSCRTESIRRSSGLNREAWRKRITAASSAA